jgi:Ca2+-binding RTX toxin-like protein
VIGCALVLVVGCAGGRSGAPQEEKQGHTEDTKEQGRSSGAASEQGRCDGTQTFKRGGMVYTTNDLPGCPDKGGQLSGTDGPDQLVGGEGDDEIRGFGAADFIPAGVGNDVIYGGSGDDTMWAEEGNDVIYGGDGDDMDMMGGKGQDVLYGGDGNDFLDAMIGDWQQRDRLYCGEGIDAYLAGKSDYVSSSCEDKMRRGRAVP